MRFRWRACFFMTGVLLVTSVAQSQHAGHDMAGMGGDSAKPTMFHLMAQAIPLVTRASPSAGGQTRTEGDVTQLIVMAHASWWSDHARVDAALNGEGLTMPKGELNTGAYGEGYVDRRHPHAYLHELMVTAAGTAGPVQTSLSAGRGFVSFGTDDPMMRPIVKFPINHHLSQILERAEIVGAAHLGAVTVEGTTFGGDEPTSPSSLPRIKRFGDSWAARGTLLPTAGSEIQASYARVASPEEPAGFGLDQRKQNISARTISSNGNRYAMAEWARTVERDHSRALDVFGYESALAEGAMLIGRVGLSLRVEQTDRPEEERLTDPFRTPRPPTDLSINGITRWRVGTAQLAGSSVTRHGFSGFPFLEVARLAASPRDARSLFTPERLYGTSRFWMVTAGFRLRVGSAHGRMGRYGAAETNGTSIATMMGSDDLAHVH